MSNINPNNYGGVTVVLVGNATRDPETKFEGKQTELDIAVNLGYKNKETDQWVETGVNYYTVIASGDAANALKQVGKGDRVRVDEARLEQREYDKKDGTKGYSNELRFGTVTVVKKKVAGGQSQGNPVPPAGGEVW